MTLDSSECMSLAGLWQLKLFDLQVLSNNAGWNAFPAALTKTAPGDRRSALARANKKDPEGPLCNVAAVVRTASSV